MRTTKRIIIRIIVAVAVAVILSKLKFIGIMNVSALEVYNSNADNFCIYTTSSSQCDSNLQDWARYSQTYKRYTYLGTANFESVSFRFQLPNNKNREYYLNGVFLFYGGNTGESSFPVRAWVTDGTNTSSCNVEGSFYNQEAGYPRSYIFSCKVFQGNSNHVRVIFGGPFANYDSNYAISPISTIWDRDDVLALQTQNNYLQQIRNSLNDTNNKLQTMIDLQNQNNQTQTQIQNNTKETNDLIKSDDTTDADSKGADFFNNFENDSHGLSGVITAPLSFIQSLTSKSCTPLHLEIGLVDKEFDLPCATTLMQQNFPSVLEFYQTITFGVISYLILIKIFGIVKDAKNPDSDKIEVLDL